MTMTERAEPSDDGRPDGAAARSGRLAPPEWLALTLRATPGPMPKAAAVRAAIGIGAPLAVGVLVDDTASGALVAIGALGAVFGDTADAYRLRVLNIAVPQIVGAIGLALGSAQFGHGWSAVAMLTVLALVAGMISTIGAVASASGLNLLLMAVIGAGLPMPSPWWRAPMLTLAGAGLVLLMALLAWPARSRIPERDAVADAYDATANLLAAAGTEEWEPARAEVTLTLNHAYDLLLGRRAVAPGRSRGMSRLVALLNAVGPLVEAGTATHAEERSVAEVDVATVREIAAAVRGGTVPVGSADRSGVCAPADRAVAAAITHARETLSGAYRVPDRVGRPGALPERVAAGARALLVSAESWRYGLRLMLCIGVAQALVSVVDVPRSYWVPLTVTFVLKPDFGSVFSRALLRALGTAAGLVVAGVILEFVPRGGWEVPVVLVLAAALPILSRRGYGYQTAVITPLILILSDLLGHQGVGLLAPRLVDSLIGCAIVLVVGYALWPESWHTRVGARLATAIEDTARYIECAFDENADQAARARTRRRIYRDLSDVRTEFQRALGEPPPAGARAAAWWPLIVAVERVIDTGTAAAVHTAHGAPPPSPEAAAHIAAELRALAASMRSEGLGAVGAVPAAAAVEEPQDVFSDVRREVRSVRSTLDGPSEASEQPKKP
ncbi:FUSC family protein [Embleya sp. MST-111070]|uniref:FUSC family protein n=1 Tax=Embleya sp. MST-111070 TaxID=3398231 RepID=UPI003F73FB68